MKKLIFLLSLALATLAHANDYFPVLGDIPAMLEPSYGRPTKIENYGVKGRRLIWETKYNYAVCCEFDYEDRLQSVQICMYKDRPMLIKWAFQEMFLWTDTDYDDWQELQPDHSGNRCFITKDKSSGRQIDVTLFSGSANLSIAYDDWLGVQRP